MAAEAGSNALADTAARRREKRRGALRRWFGCLCALRRAEDGISAVEFALCTPFLLGLILPLLDLGQCFSEQIRVNMAVQAGAQYASLNLWGSTASTDITAVVNGATTLALTSVTAVQKCGCPNTSGSPTLWDPPTAPSTCATTTCTADSTTGAYYVQVTATYTHPAVVPYSASPSTLSSTAVVRTN